jgi:O-antigen ligase
MGSISEAGSNGSFLGRVVSWKVAIVSAMDNPFFGSGTHALQDSTIWNKYINEISSLTFITTPDIPPFPLAAHSIFFEVLGDAGFSGLLCFVGILFMSIFYCGAIVKRCKNRPDLLWANDLARLLRVSVIVYIAAGSALSFAYFEGFWIVVAIISRLNHTTRQLTRSQPEAAEAAVPV